MHIRDYKLNKDLQETDDKNELFCYLAPRENGFLLSTKKGASLIPLFEELNQETKDRLILPALACIEQN